MSRTSRDTVSSNKQPEIEAKIIVFNRQKKIKHFGPCSFEVNAKEKWIISKPKTEGMQPIESPFDRTFVQKENWLGVINHVSSTFFVVIFADKNCCFDQIDKINPARHPASEDPRFLNYIYIPLLKEIKNEVAEYLDLKELIVKLVNALEPATKQIFLEKASEVGVQFDGIVGDESHLINDNDVDNNIDDDGGDDDGNEQNQLPELEDAADEMDSDHDETDSENNIDFQPRPNYDEEEPPRRKRERSVFNEFPSDNEEAPIFEIVTFFQNGDYRRRLLIFTSAEKKECYEFYISPGYLSKNHFVCKKCCYKNHNMPIKVITDQNGIQKLHFCQNKAHICQPFEYSPDYYKSRTLVKPPNFELYEREFAGKISKRMRIFVSNDRMQWHEYRLYASSANRYHCYECKKNFGRKVSAKLYPDDNFVELALQRHYCKPKKLKSHS